MGITATTATQIEAAEWADLVSADGEATFFHTLDWSELLARNLGGWSPRFVLAREGETLVGGLPLMKRRRGPFTILQSMPFGTYGGAVLLPGAPPETAARLLEEAAATAASPNVASLVIVDLPDRLGAAARALGFVGHEEVAQIVRLDRPYREIWSAFRPSARNKIRKAEKAGVTVRRGESPRDFAAYHDMLLECCRRWGTRPEFGRGFFEGMASLDTGRAQLWLAEHAGGIVGGDLNFTMHGTIVNWGNVSRDSARSLAPNNLLHATGMREGAAAGFRIFDLGSSAGIRGVEAFKEAFGTERVPYRRYHMDKPWFRTARRLAGRGPKEDGS